MKKRIPVLLLTVVLIMGSLVQAAAAQEAPAPDMLPDVFPDGVYMNEADLSEDEGPTVSSRDVDFYLRIPKNDIVMPLYFVNGVEDLPYINLMDWADLMVTVMQKVCGDKDYGLNVETDGDLVQLTRENGYSIKKTSKYRMILRAPILIRWH